MCVTACEAWITPAVCDPPAQKDSAVYTLCEKKKGYISSTNAGSWMKKDDTATTTTVAVANVSSSSSSSLSTEKRTETLAGTELLANALNMELDRRGYPRLKGPVWPKPENNGYRVEYTLPL